MSYSYVVTSQKATAVSHAVSCSFTAPNEKNLIVAKGNYLLVYVLRDDNIELVMESPLFGKIKCLEYYRQSTASTDSLFILTERKSFCVLGYDNQSNKLITRAVGNVRDRAGRDVEIGQRGLIDPDFRMIGMMLYEGHLKIIPVEANGMKEAVNISLDETRIIDIKFLHGCSRPTVCVLYQDNRQIRHVKTLHVEVREKDTSPGPWSQSNVEYGASLLIPVPAPIGGVLVVGASSITYIGQTASVLPTGEFTSQMHIQAVEIAPTLISSFACIAEDGSRFLLADHRGVLSVVVLRTGAHHEVQGLVIDTLGTTSIAENLTYLGDGLLFVGSIFGDSQLVRLHSQKDAEGSNVEILSVHPNIGPIKDMCLVDNDKQGGQRQLVTCSGAYKDGSLRVIRSGIGLQEQASLDVGGIKGLWSLRTNERDAFDKYLVQSFLGETRVLAIENEEMGEVEIGGFSSQEPTLYCANVQGGALVQVTPRSVRLVDSESFALLAEYIAPRTITVASGTLTQVTLALSGGELHYLEVDTANKRIALVASSQLDQDIACVSLRPLDSAVEESSEAMDVDAAGSESVASPTTVARSSIVAIAMWTDNSVRLHALPTLEEICRVQLGTDTQARDILLVTLGGKSYLLVGLGDGRLITYTVDFSTDLPSLTNKRNGVLGTHRITFSVFENAGALCVFAACDRPTIMYSKNGKILFSVLDVNQTEFTNMAPFHSELFPNCLALSSETSLLIGVIEDIQKVHIQTIALNQNPRRITHSASHAVYGVTAEKTSRTSKGEETRSRVLFFEDGNLAQIGVYELDPLEQGISIATCTFDNDPASSSSSNDAAGASGTMSSPAPAHGSASSSGSSSTGGAAGPQKTEYFVVGTAHVINGESEPSRGRILVFEIAADRQVFLIAEKEVRGAVYSLAQTSGRLVAGVGSKVSVFNLVGGKEDLSNFTGQPELLHECSHTSQIMTLFLKTKGDVILVGDLVRSMTVLRYSVLEKKLVEVARDFHSSYLRAVEILDGANEDIYMGTDIHGNLQCMRHQAEAATDEERCKLEACGEFSIGEYLNCFRRGSLVGQPIDADTSSSAWHSSVKSPTGEKRDAGILSNNYQSITGLRAGTSSVLYGGVSGAVGNVIALSEESYKFFASVERVMKRVVVSIGGLNHRDWRCLQNDLRTAPQRNMIDGDLVEMLLELDREALLSATREINDELTLVFAAPVGAVDPAGGIKANAQATAALSKASTGAMLLDLSTQRIALTPEDIVHRVEDISRLH